MNKALVLIALLLCAAAPAPAPPPAPAQPPALPSEIPAQFTTQDTGFDYSERSVMIPMRDGVRLRTIILIPKGAHDAPILLTRTPYGAEARLRMHPSATLAGLLGDSDEVDDLVVHHGFIRVLQDIRGKHGSEGAYVMTRPLVGPLNPTKVDESTDAWDTIDWLVHNVSQSNGRVGILGISYDGFTALMALFHPHPALKAVVPINAMVDGWMGDDWFHRGAFRTGSLPYIYDQEATRGSTLHWWSSAYDDYTELMQAGDAGTLGREHGEDQLGFFTKLVAHPAYDSFWQDQAIDKLLAAQAQAGHPISVPTLLVHSLWDQEDIYGNIAVYKALKPYDKAGMLHLVIGPWFHHQERLDGSAIGPIRFGSDTAAAFRDKILEPFLERTLAGDTHAIPVAPVSDFVTGMNRWERRATWPGPTQSATLHLGPLAALGFSAPPAAAPGYRTYVSDPANPVPFLPRPIHLSGAAGERLWQTWLASDQRAVSGRPDVLTYVTAPLTAPLRISGQPVAHIDLSTTGTDGDLVVKLIDQYPAMDGRDPNLGGYELMVSGDILRGRYRESFSDPKPLIPGKVLPWRLVLPPVNHVFLPGHRIMVQIQSSWFPLYDRNPQNYVANIFFAQPSDYRSAEIHIQDSSTITLPISK
ncbi:CocE/NonD family hydrolase [Lichenicoccus sp.]|uniref:CocE/NonD family hydrolase n=1 Tax=Lichenicoccus sp. TaxID=2781899 RepID=UPI003D12BE68